MSETYIKTQAMQLDSLLNIMDREIYEFSEFEDSNATPQRIDDFRALVTSMKEVVKTLH